MKKLLTVFIGFAHDFAAGAWAATVVAVAFLERTGLPSEVAVVLQDLQKEFFYLGLGCTLLVFITGAGRGFTYVEDYYGKPTEAARKKMLMIKHLVLLVIFGGGTWWQYFLAFG